MLNLLSFVKNFNNFLLFQLNLLNFTKRHFLCLLCSFFTISLLFWLLFLFQINLETSCGVVCGSICWKLNSFWKMMSFEQVWVHYLMLGTRLLEILPTTGASPTEFDCAISIWLQQNWDFWIFACDTLWNFDKFQV